MPLTLSPEQLAARELQSRGVDKTTGTFGDHKVQIGSAKPLRIDKLKPDRIPFQGFRTATRISRGAEGLKNSALKVLSTLVKPGALDAGTLLGALRTTQEYSQRLSKLGTDAPSSALELFAPLVEDLSNADLAKAYQMLATPQADLLMTALTHEGRSNPEASDARRCAEALFDVQALLLKEVSNRASRGIIEREIQKNPDQADMLQRMSPRSLAEQYAPGAQRPQAHARAGDVGVSAMAALVEVAAQGATMRERGAAEAAGMIERRHLGTFTPKEAGDMLRACDLTINVGENSLLLDTSFLANPDKPMPNIFLLNEQGIAPKGQGYLAVRDSAERALFPEFEGQAPRGDERPVYAALNTAKAEMGAAASSYGSSVVVLKPEVMRRATFIADDSFYSPKVSITPQKVEAFYALLDGACSPQLAGELRNAGSERGALLRTFLDRVARTEDPNISIFQSLDSNMIPSGESEAVTALMIDAFADRQATRSRMATYDSLENLFMGLDDLNGTMLGEAAQRFHESGEGRFRLSGNYIEAQVHGPIIPSRDIAELRIDLAAFHSGEERAQARQKAEDFGAATGAKITFLDSGALTRDSNTLGMLLNEGVAHAAAHFDPKDIASARDRILGDPDAALREVLSGMPAAARQRLDQGGAILMGNALPAAMDKFARALSQRQPESATDLYAGDFVKRVFRESVGPMLELKASLLQELDTLDFETEGQKASFEAWVRSAGKLRSPQELRTIHDCAKDQAAVFRAIASNPGMGPGGITQAFCNAIPGINAKLESLINSFPESVRRDFGKDDKNNELDRVVSMALSFAEKGNPPMDADGLRTLHGALNSGAMRFEISMTLNLLMSFVSNVQTARAGGDNPVVRDFASLDTLATMLISSFSTLNSNLKAGGDFPDCLLDPSFMGAASRKAIATLSPEAGRILEERFPARAAFPEPANPQSMPSDDEQRRKFLVSFLDTYVPRESTFERGTSTHGRGHIARAYIFAKAMASILQENGVKVDLNAVLCGIAGHDAGREGGGDDQWEERSAEMTAQKMRDSYPGAMGEDYEKAVRAAIVTGGPQTTEAMLLHAADSLDYGRVGPMDLSRFGFLKAPEGESTSDSAVSMRKELAREADLLERITNPLCQYRQTLDHLTYAKLDALNAEDLARIDGDREALKDAIAKAFEKESENSSEDFMGKFEKVLSDNQGLFPLLSRYYFASGK